MLSAAQRGAYFKARTKVWLERHGWQVADLEIVRWVGGNVSGVRFPVKRDQFASDLLAINADHILMVQVKSGKTAPKTIAPALRAFKAFTFPPGVSCVVLAWQSGARSPSAHFLGEAIPLRKGQKLYGQTRTSEGQHEQAESRGDSQAEGAA